MPPAFDPHATLLGPPSREEDLEHLLIFNCSTSYR